MGLIPASASMISPAQSALSSKRLAQKSVSAKTIVTVDPSSCSAGGLAANLGETLSNVCAADCDRASIDESTTSSPVAARC
jgi:hypothetical protein